MFFSRAILSSPPTFFRQVSSGKAGGDGSPLYLRPNSELLILSSVKFERDMEATGAMDMYALEKVVRVRIPGREGGGGNGGVDNHSGGGESAPGASFEQHRRRDSRIVLSHEDVSSSLTTHLWMGSCETAPFVLVFSSSFLNLCLTNW